MPTAKLVAGPKLPLPSPSSTLTVLLSSFTTARSGMLSPLKSLTATEVGSDPTVKNWAGPKRLSRLRSSKGSRFRRRQGGAVPQGRLAFWRRERLEEWERMVCRCHIQCEKDMRHISMKKRSARSDRSSAAVRRP